MISRLTAAAAKFILDLQHARTDDQITAAIAKLQTALSEALRQMK